MQSLLSQTKIRNDLSLKCNNNIDLSTPQSKFNLKNAFDFCNWIVKPYFNAIEMLDYKNYISKMHILVALYINQSDASNNLFDQKCASEAFDQYFQHFDIWKPFMEYQTLFIDNHLQIDTQTENSMFRYCFDYWRNDSQTTQFNFGLLPFQPFATYFHEISDILPINVIRDASKLNYPFEIQKYIENNVSIDYYSQGNGVNLLTKKGSQDYELSAAMFKTGNPQSGHWTAMVKYDKYWFYCDDIAQKAELITQKWWNDKTFKQTILAFFLAKK